MTTDALVAQLGMREFDPTCERHYPLLIVKAVDPGCTLELQVERWDGQVVRLTTTDSPERDEDAFEAAVLEAFREAWMRFRVTR